MSIPFDRALLLTLGGTLLVALIAGGVTLDRRLAAELEEDARSDLAMAPTLFIDRQATQGEMLRMHAAELAGSPELGAALRAGARAEAVAMAEGLAGAWPEGPVVVGSEGEVWVGPGVSSRIVPSETMAEGPYGVVFDEGALHALALAPVMDAGAPVGVAGVALPFDQDMAQTISGLTRSDLVFMGADGAVVASTLDSAVTAALAPRVPASHGGPVTELEVGGAGRYWTATAELGSAGTVLFVQSAERELAALPRLRRAGLVAAGLALMVTLLVGLLVARQLSRPIRELADASLGLAGGNFELPLPTTRVAEVETVSRAFATMRTALAARLRELADANQELADRQERLQALQSELIQRDRLVAAGRLVTELAHEIRNPVANVRNSLEVVRRHVDDPKAREFTDLAIDELLRMHELAERMLDLNRPERDGSPDCDARAVIDDVVQLVELGDREGSWPISVEGPEAADIRIPADSLKRVVLNLVTNAQDATPDGGPIEIRLACSDGSARIEVGDHGPGISPEVLPQMFDPFFTTKEDVHGVGLGLFIAEGVIRSHGGSLSATNRSPGTGALLRIELPRGSA